VTLAERVSDVSRRRKFRLFMEVVAPGSETTVVDVGADDLGYAEEGEWGTANFLEELYPWRGQITAVGVHEGSRFRARYPEIPWVRADGCDLPFEDGAFDVLFSNAVLEHVGGPERQRRFVSEALRVARRVFITTPNRWFPLEVHTRLPLVHWLPPGTRTRAYELLGKGWANDLDLLGPADLRALFPPDARVRVVNSVLTLAAVAGR
jgi:SAM-dependent methyltransferase